MNYPQRVELPELAESYLKELTFALRNTTEREGVLYEVRSHLAQAVQSAQPGQQDAAVRAALAELGTVEQIAGTATVQPASVETEEGSPQPGMAYTIGLVLAIIAVPAALLVPAIGAAFAVAVFGWVVFGLQGRRKDNWVPVVIASVAVIVGILMFTLQIPAGPVPTSVPLPVISD